MTECVLETSRCRPYKLSHPVYCHCHHVIHWTTFDSLRLPRSKVAWLSRMAWLLPLGQPGRPGESEEGEGKHHTYGFTQVALLQRSLQ
ncbi:hypothetical protein DM01DRAFT_1184786 [Hesseltinella vesiculosa]|uniref:Uncharacterized protein n=1 Tax=Hesseltinella vesiculosa TaxID=101127 RepID=A0A1X2GQJ4_9FUNG|nr:hypothetical protein DM01DRAFT_1184786 [Hesseltinella vesiculosa]